MPVELRLYLMSLDKSFSISDYYPYNFLGVVERAHAENIRIVAGETSLSYLRVDGTHGWSEKRYLLMNHAMKSIIEEDRKKAPQGKSLVLLGYMHLGFRDVKALRPDDSRVIPGVDKIFDAPSVVVHVDEQDELDEGCYENVNFGKVQADYLVTQKADVTIKLRQKATSEIIDYINRNENSVDRAELQRRLHELYPLLDNDQALSTFLQDVLSKKARTLSPSTLCFLMTELKDADAYANLARLILRNLDYSNQEIISIIDKSYTLSKELGLTYPQFLHKELFRNDFSMLTASNAMQERARAIIAELKIRDPSVFHVYQKERLGYLGEDVNNQYKYEQLRKLATEEAKVVERTTTNQPISPRELTNQLIMNTLYWTGKHSRKNALPIGMKQKQTYVKNNSNQSDSEYFSGLQNISIKRLSWLVSFWNKKKRDSSTLKFYRLMASVHSFEELGQRPEFKELLIDAKILPASTQNSFDL